MKEYFWAEEPLVSDVDGKLLLGDCVDARVLLDVLARLRVILVELLRQVGAHITMPRIGTH